MMSAEVMLPPPASSVVKDLAGTSLDHLVGDKLTDEYSGVERSAGGHDGQK
jgi:hypothetical protein